MKKVIALLLIIVLSGFKMNAQNEWTVFGPNNTGSFYELASQGSDVFALNIGEVLKASINGTTWTSLFYSSSIDFHCMAVYGSYIFIGTSNDQGIIYTPNGGTNFYQLTNTTSWGQIYCIKVVGGVIYTGTNAGLYKSTDYGATWTLLSTILLDQLYVSGSTFFGGNQTHGVVRSVDNGVTWNSSSSWDLSNYVMEFAKFGSKFFVATWDGLFSSSNNGTTWDQVNTLSAQDIWVGDSKIFVSTNTGIIYSSDGINWIGPITTPDYPSPGSSCTYCELTGCNGYLVTTILSQPWKGNISVIANTNDFDNQSQLQVYPNPATDKITLQNDAGIFSILEMSDMYGNIVYHNEDAKSKCEIDVTGFASGVYFLKIETDGKTIVKKVVVE